MITYSGEWVDLLTGSPIIEDIAIMQGRLCRFNGATQVFWPVLVHSLIVCDLLPDNLKIHGLLHDAAEVVISDIPSTIKTQEWEDIETIVRERIYAYMGIPLPTAEEWEKVMEADKRALNGEVYTVSPISLRNFAQFQVKDVEAIELTNSYLNDLKVEDVITPSGKYVKEMIARLNSFITSDLSLDPCNASVNTDAAGPYKYGSSVAVTRNLPPDVVIGGVPVPGAVSTSVDWLPTGNGEITTTSAQELPLASTEVLGELAAARVAIDAAIRGNTGDDVDPAILEAMRLVAGQFSSMNYTRSVQELKEELYSVRDAAANGTFTLEDIRSSLERFNNACDRARDDGDSDAPAAGAELNAPRNYRIAFEDSDSVTLELVEDVQVELHPDSVVQGVINLMVRAREREGTDEF